MNTDGSAPDSSAILDVKSSTMGFLAPRMTFEQRNAIVNPDEGLMVICTNCGNAGSPVISVFLAGKWLNVTALCESPSTKGSRYFGMMVKIFLFFFIFGHIPNPKFNLYLVPDQPPLLIFICFNS